MKKILLFSLLLATAHAFASQADSLFQRHQLSFSITNGMSHEFLKGASGPTVNRREYGIWSQSYYKYLPGYAVHVGFTYSLGIIPSIRFETGLGYTLQGITVKGDVYLGDFILDHRTYTDHQYTGRLNIPLHMKFIKAVGKGAFTCAIGPSFNFDLHNFNVRNNYVINGKNQPDATTKNALDYYFGGLGIDLRMGYEKRLNKRSSIDIGPIVSFTNLALFNKYLKSATVYAYDLPHRAFDYYIGLDVAVNFGLKK